MGKMKPYFYVAGQPSANRTRHETAAVKIIQSAIRKKRRPKAKSVAKLTRSVAKLKVAQNGAPQMSRQNAEWNVGGPVTHTNYISNIRPLCFLHQAISVNSPIHSLYPQPGIGIDLNEAGEWKKQIFPLTQPVLAQPAGQGYPTSYNKYDQLQYWGESEGVQNRYFHSSTLYQMQCTGVACTGFVDVFLIHPKRSFNPSEQQDVNLPNSLPGFTHLSLGDNNMYSVNPQYFSCKRIKRHYFNTARLAGGGASSERELQTNPDFDIQFRIVNAKSRRLIRAPEQFQGAILDSTDIPYSKQDWILISTTIDDRDSTPDNHIRIQSLNRTCYWRDYLGAST